MKAGITNIQGTALKINSQTQISAEFKNTINKNEPIYTLSISGTIYAYNANENFFWLNNPYQLGYAKENGVSGDTKTIIVTHQV